MCIRISTPELIRCVAILVTLDFSRGGWLDRVVQHRKTELMMMNDIVIDEPVEINASIIAAPQGYEDSDNWDFDSVLHLLILLKHSGMAASVHRSLRRMVAPPTRRLMMGMGESLINYPSLAKQSLNEFYYDIGSAEDYPEESEVIDKDIILITNPVEAKLPSSRISVKLLKEILIARALIERETPPPRRAIPWKKMNTTRRTTRKTPSTKPTKPHKPRKPPKSVKPPKQDKPPKSIKPPKPPNKESDPPATIKTVETTTANPPKIQDEFDDRMFTEKGF